MTHQIVYILSDDKKIRLLSYDVLVKSIDVKSPNHLRLSYLDSTLKIYLSKESSKLLHFNYIKELKLTDQVLVIANTQTLSKYYKYFTESNKSKEAFDYVSMNNETKSNIKGIVCFELPQASQSKYPLYKPFSYFWGTKDECSAGITPMFKKVPSNNKRSFRWEAVQACSKLSKPKCMDADTCQWKHGKGCSRYPRNQNVRYRQLLDILRPYKYYIFSPTTLTEFEDIHSQRTHYKPNGLWFGKGNEWLQFITYGGDASWVDSYNYMYEIKINKENLIVIDDHQALIEFNQKYKTKQPFYINWQRVVDETKKDGILISVNFKEIYYTKNINLQYNDYLPDWYSTWDIASGAIWNSNGIKSIHPVYKKESGKWIKMNNKAKTNKQTS